MQFSRRDVWNIVAAVVGGGAVFGSVACVNAIARKKVIIDLHVDTPNLLTNDHSLCVFLTELNRIFYTRHAIECNQIAQCAEEIVILRLNVRKLTPNQIKTELLSKYNMYKKSMQVLLDRHDKEAESVVRNIHTHVDSHMEAVMAMYPR
jgi:hypothetical protein